MKLQAVRLVIVLLSFLVFASARGGEKATDTALRKKLLGYWASPRHYYLLKDDGIMYWCPRSSVKMTNTWDVKGGRYFQDGEAFEIVSLTPKKFVYRELGKERIAYTFIRITEKVAEED